MVVTSNVSFNIASLNEVAHLMCNGSGGPNNTYKWTKDGKVVDGEVDNTLTMIIINDSSGGNYTCIVKNAAGIDSDSTTLYIAPYIKNPLEQKLLRMNGSNLSIICETDGFPSPNVTWERINKNMTGTVVSTTSLLEVNPVVFGNEGLYRCIASFEIREMMHTASHETTLIGMNPVLSNSLSVKFVCTCSAHSFS